MRLVGGDWFGIQEPYPSMHSLDGWPCWIDGQPRIECINEALMGIQNVYHAEIKLKTRAPLLWLLFSRRLWRTLLSWCLVKHPSFCWDEILAWGERHAKGRSLRSNVFCLALWSAAYLIWEMVCFIKGEFMLKKISLNWSNGKLEGELKGMAIVLILSKTEFCVVYGEFL